MLTARQTLFTERLLRSNQPVTLSTLAQELNVSTRTLQRDLQAVKRWLADRGITLVARSGIGLELSASADLREKALARLGTAEVDEPLLPSQRQRLILQELLQNPTGTKLAYLSRRLGVTEATVSHDLDQIEPWLAQRGLTLIRRPGFGIQVSGSEGNLRTAIIDFLRGSLTDEQVLQLVRKVTHRGGKDYPDAFIQQLLHFTDEQTVTRVLELVRELDQRMDLHMAESAIAGLVVHLSLAVERLRKGEVIQLPPATLAALRKTPEWTWAQSLAKQVDEALGVTIPAEEIGFITMHLQGARLRAPGIRKESEPQPRPEILELSVAMVRRAAQVLGAPLDRDAELIHSLAVHLGPAINRLRLGLEVRNPLLEPIKEEYSVLFEASRSVCQVLSGYTGVPVPEGEIGYVALHLGAAVERLRSTAPAVFHILVVCPSGTGSSQMLASRISVELPEAEVMDIVAVGDLPQFLDGNRSRPDLILSTVTLECLECDAVPVVVVSPLLPEEDLQRVRQELEQLARNRRQSPLPFLGSALGKRTTTLGLTCQRATSPAAVVREATRIGRLILDLQERFCLQVLDDAADPVAAAAILAEQAKIAVSRRQIEADLREREALGTTLVTDDLQLLHARTYGVCQPFVGLLRKPHRTVVVMLAPRQAAVTVLDLLGAISSSLVEHPEYADILRKEPEEQIRQLIVRILQPVMFQYLVGVDSTCGSPENLPGPS